jgi:hypothetical protein
MDVSRQPDNLAEDVLAGRILLHAQRIMSSTCTRKEPHAAGQYLRVALVLDDRRVIGPQPLSFRFCPLGSGGLLQKQSPGHYSFSTSTLPKPCSASRGALRDVPTPRAAIAFTVAFTASFLHCARCTTANTSTTTTTTLYHNPLATQQTRSLPTAPPDTDWLRAQKPPIKTAGADAACRSLRMFSSQRMPPGPGPKQKPAASPPHDRDGKTHGLARMLLQRRFKSSSTSAHRK